MSIRDRIEQETWRMRTLGNLMGTRKPCWVELTRAEKWVETFRMDHGRRPSVSEACMFPSDFDPPSCYARAY
jgi:hypothetical protein